MRVNELAKQAGVEAHVVRFYTQTGLLHPGRHPKNHYREYADSDIDRVRFIRRARWLGFTLQDIKAILGDADKGVSPCSMVREIIKLRAQENHGRLEDLRRLQARVEQALASWESMPDQPPDHQSLCHLIDAVAQDDGSLA
jgi:DNA-binding transcriptional MerR regulator